MPLDTASYLSTRGWKGKGTALRDGHVTRPLPTVVKRSMTGVGKDRDEAVPFWDNIFASAALSIKLATPSATPSISQPGSGASTPVPGSTTTLPSEKLAQPTAIPSSGSHSSLNPHLRARKEMARRRLYSGFNKGAVLADESLVEEDVTVSQPILATGSVGEASDVASGLTHQIPLLRCHVNGGSIEQGKADKAARKAERAQRRADKEARRLKRERKEGKELVMAGITEAKARAGEEGNIDDVPDGTAGTTSTGSAALEIDTGMGNVAKKRKKSRPGHLARSSDDFVVSQGGDISTRPVTVDSARSSHEMKERKSKRNKGTTMAGTSESVFKSTVDPAVIRADEMASLARNGDLIPAKDEATETHERGTKRKRDKGNARSKGGSK